MLSWTFLAGRKDLLNKIPSNCIPVESWVNCIVWKWNTLEAMGYLLLAVPIPVGSVRIRTAWVNPVSVINISGTKAERVQLFQMFIVNYFYFTTTMCELLRWALNHSCDHVWDELWQEPAGLTPALKKQDSSKWTLQTALIFHYFTR
jgi:hypothetical protein